jgi:hypothetical protein
MGRPVQEEWDFEAGELPTIDAHTQDYWVKMGRIAHRLAREAVDSAGVKQGAELASDVRANPTQFSEALKDGGPKRFAIEWVPRLFTTPKGVRLLRFFCAVLQMEPRPLPIRSAEEKLKRLVSRIESKGAMGRELLREEFGRETDELLRAARGEDLA